ncbi:spindle assembly abnormal protein 6 homolog isoform X2 [Protopterus annectens]|uniref:spindle assembly abnormal protein 6 homolog isoform X2 n=1 Tax=Protopterus annectens TaxID=7888 RepID=UPI001CFA206E|nr:spindle assembly abnormal protein 6 homolog isoform X2 [Protopterus annectens]
MAMAEELFCKVVSIVVKCKDCEDRRINVRITVETHPSTNPIHKKDLVVRLTDDTDLYFLYNLKIGEEDFLNLKSQQGLLVEFSAFPQRFIDLLEQSISEQVKEVPRFLLQLVTASPALDHMPASLDVVETNPFKHLTHLSLRLLPGNDNDIKKYLAGCLRNLKTENSILQETLHRTEDDLSKRLSITQQTLAEKSKELDRLRNEWTSQSSLLTTRHTQEIAVEREKAHQMQTQCQQQYEQQKREMEAAHKKAVHHLESKVEELELVNKDLLEKKYKFESSIREMRARLSGLEEENQRTKQEVVSLRRENSTLDSECHEKEKVVNQLKTKTAVLEQEVKDKEQVLKRINDVFESAQEHKKKIEESLEEKQVQIGKLEATLKSLSEELLKANEIIKKQQSDIKKLMEKSKLKNAVTMQQEKILEEKGQTLQRERLELNNVKQALTLKEQQASALQEQLDAATQKLEECKQMLKTNENVINWLNKQLNENKIMAMQSTSGQSDLPPSVVAGSTSCKFGAQKNPLQQHPLHSTPASMSKNSWQSSALASYNSSQNFVPYLRMNAPPLDTRMPRPCLKVHFGPTAISSPAAEPRPFPQTSTPTVPAVSSANDPPGLDMKYLQRQDTNIPVRIQKPATLPSAVTTRPLLPKQGSQQAVSAYFPGAQPRLPAS